LHPPVSATARVASADATENQTKKGEIMTSKTLRAEDLRQFTGSEHWYLHGLVRNVLFTDGAKYVADHGGA
jgi:hypothetical protein